MFVGSTEPLLAFFFFLITIIQQVRSTIKKPTIFVLCEVSFGGGYVIL